MIKKAIHRVIVLWCLYGLYRGMSFASPYLYWASEKVVPDLIYGEPNGPDYGFLWFLVVMGAIVSAFVYFVFTAFCGWFFKEEKDNDDETWGKWADRTDGNISKLSSSINKVKTELGIDDD